MALESLSSIRLHGVVLNYFSAGTNLNLLVINLLRWLLLLLLLLLLLRGSREHVLVRLHGVVLINSVQEQI
jgi:hypothetical protein